MAENKSLTFQKNHDNNFHFDNYIYPNNNNSLTHNKDQIKELNYKYINTTEERDLQENQRILNNSSHYINPKIQSDILNKNNYDSYYLNNYIPKIIEPNVYLKNPINNINNNNLSGCGSINYDTYPAYSSKTNLSYNTNNSIERDNLNSYFNVNNSNNNNNNNNNYLYTNNNHHRNLNNKNSNIANQLETSTNSVNLNSNLDKLLENLKNHSQELEGKNNENIKLKEENYVLGNTINNLEGTCIGLREENEYIIFIKINFFILSFKIIF